MRNEYGDGENGLNSTAHCTVDCRWLANDPGVQLRTHLTSVRSVDDGWCVRRLQRRVRTRARICSASPVIVAWMRGSRKQKRTDRLLWARQRSPCDRKAVVRLAGRGAYHVAVYPRLSFPPLQHSLVPGTRTESHTCDIAALSRRT
jgi:hypothetical protein